MSFFVASPSRALQSHRSPFPSPSPCPSPSPSSPNPHGGGASPRSFFSDAVKPSAFVSIEKWNELRDFLFYFGSKYKSDKSEASDVYSDRRRYAYEVGKLMNEVQNYYSELIMMVMLKGRLIVENACGIFAPPQGFPNPALPKTVVEKLRIIRGISAEMQGVVDHCEVINESGDDVVDDDDDEHNLSDKGKGKGKVVDAIFVVCLYIRRHFETNWPADAERAKEWSANPHVYQLRSEPSHNDRVTEVQLWLADVGLSDCRAAFADNGILDVETLLMIKNEGDAAVTECLDSMKLPFGFRIKFKNKIASVTAATADEYRRALWDLNEEARLKPLEEARLRQEEEAVLAAARAAQSDEQRREDERLWAVREQYRGGTLQLRVTDLGKDYRPRGWFNALPQWPQHGAVDYGRWVGTEPHVYWSVAVAGRAWQLSAEGEFQQPDPKELKNESQGVYSAGLQFYEAAAAGDLSKLVAILQEWGAEESVVNWANPHGWTPLLAAAWWDKHECLGLLVAVPGIDVNQANNNGETPLFAAAHKGHPQCVAPLLAAPGIAVNRAATAGFHKGKTPLAAAEKKGRNQCAELLRAHGGKR